MANYLSVEKRKRIFHLLCEGNGIRSIQRVVGCSNTTVAALQKRFFEIVSHINRRYIKDLDIEEIEADEIRTFVYNKTNLKWIYIALDKKSRMVLHFHVGKRDTKDARKFLLGLSDKLNSTSKVSTDCLKSYVSAIANTPENASILSQAESIDLMRSKQVGRKLGRSITNKIEAHNGNVRQHISRLIRRTRCFSKKDEALSHHLTLFFFYYNFIKQHKALKTSPCVTIGILKKPFSFDELIEYDLMLTGQSIKKEQPVKHHSIPDVVIESAIGNPTLMEYEEKIQKLEMQNAALISKNNKRMVFKEIKLKTESAAAALGRLGGMKGGKARAAKLSPERRSEIAQKAAMTRWGNREVVHCSGMF